MPDAPARLTVQQPARNNARRGPSDNVLELVREMARQQARHDHEQEAGADETGRDLHEV